MKYVKKPHPVDAIQWTGDNYDEICAFMAETNTSAPPRLVDDILIIYTLEGTMHVYPSYYVLRGIVGEYWGCREDIFNQTYEPYKEEN